MILTSILGKALAITDAFLGYFVTVNSFRVENICGGEWYIMNYELTACGTTFVQDLVQLVAGLTHLAPALLAGLFATNV